MASVSRKQALVRTAAAAASADWLPALLPKLHAYPLDMPAGGQTYPVRALIAQDFPGTNDLLFQFQSQCSTITKGFDPVAYFTKYPGRFYLDAPRPGSPGPSATASWEVLVDVLKATGPTPTRAAGLRVMYPLSSGSNHALYAPEESWAKGPPKAMKNASCSATTVAGSAALPFVISTGAQRSGEICGFSGPFLGMFFDRAV